MNDERIKQLESSLQESFARHEPKPGEELNWNDFSGNIVGIIRARYLANYTDHLNEDEAKHLLKLFNEKSATLGGKQITWEQCLTGGYC